eukprot:54788_1
MGNVQGPVYPPYYEEIRDFAESQQYNVSETIYDYRHQNQPIPLSCNTWILRTLHIIFIIGVMCDIIMSSIYASPFLLFSSKIDDESTIGFMGDVSFIFMYILTFMSFIGVTICLCHFCCMIFFEHCVEYGGSIVCQCSVMVEDIICNGHVPLVDIRNMCIFCLVFFIIFCISPALVLYLGLCLFCRSNGFQEMYYISINNTVDPSRLSYAGKLRGRMIELNPDHNEIKTLFMKALIMSLYSNMCYVNEHKKNCREIIMYTLYNSASKVSTVQEHKRMQLLDKMFDFYRSKVPFNEYVNHFSCSEACLYSGCGIWIALYAVIVSIFLICFGYSENSDNNFLWMYYIVSYSVFLVLFLLIVLLHYLDPLCRMKQNFGWTRHLKWTNVRRDTFAKKTNEIWDAAQMYICLQCILQQKWLVQLIMEYTEFGDINTWPSFSIETV